MFMTFALSGQAVAIGLGDLRGQATLGAGVSLQIPLLGAEKLNLDPGCFRLIQPTSGDLPWLKRGSFSIQPGQPPVLEIRSAAPLREPLMQVVVYLACGHEVSREYTLMASPSMTQEVPEKTDRALVAPGAVLRPVSEQPMVSSRRTTRSRPALQSASDADVSPVAVSKKQLPSRQSPSMPDRVVWSEGGEVGEPSLRLAVQLETLVPGIREAQREVLRLEYRMLMALNEQATTQMATAEKLRNMEGTLGELQQRAADFAQRIEKDSATSLAAQAPAATPLPSSEALKPAAPVSKPSSAAVEPVRSVDNGFSSWGWYGALLGSLLGVVGWLGWRHWQQRRQEPAEAEGIAVEVFEPEVVVDPQRPGEKEEVGGVDLPFEPAAMGMPMQVDVDLDASAQENEPELPKAERQPVHQDSVLSINATSLDEHFEANPVMELADIMLSFGRVKGAAQALQEYIDNNPQEALQPWIRLIEVYRIAGMRAEFENVARNLNKNFNVEVLNWEGEQSAAHQVGGEGAALPMAPRPQSLEDMPRLMSAVVDQWSGGDVVGYLYQLLRDNRGGQRLGFALPVVDDILFLIELKETANRME